METANIENAVLELLKNYGVTYSIAGAGKNITRDKWQCDAWKVTFTKYSEYEEFDYFTGLGHRKANEPVTPNVAGVLHSLVLDLEAINMNFNDWADSFGYDSDSIRAIGVYNACCENAKQMHRIFSRESIEKLSELLQEY